MGDAPTATRLGDPIEVLRNRLDIGVVPFTDRGSRLLVFRENGADRLYVRVCERWPKFEYTEGHYRVRPPLVRDIEFLDGAGQALSFRLVTYPHKLVVETRLGRFEMAFATPELIAIRLPAARCGLRLVVRAESAATDRRGGHTRGIRHVAYTTNAPIVHNEIHNEDHNRWRATLLVEPVADGMVTLNITPRLGFDRRVHPDATFEEAERRWRNWFAAVPAVVEPWVSTYYYAWYLMRAGLISSRYYLTREAMVPSKVHYVGLWQWDAFFHALAYRHVDAQLAHDQFRVMFDHQRPDGMVPDAVFDEGIVERLSYPVDAKVTKPPVAGWAAWRVYEVTRDRDFLAEMYEPIARWQQWWFEHCDADRDGVCQYDHPYSSGLDDSPLWDWGMPVESPDLNTYLCLQAEALANMAEVLGETRDAARWREQADAAARSLLAHLYDRAAGIFRALRMTDGGHEPVPVLTPMSLLPLWTGRLPPEVNRQLLARLRDPKTFWTLYPVPTVARSDPRYDPNQMWRGPVWVNINYLLVEALMRCGERQLARDLCDRTLRLVARHADIKEYYHPETGEVPEKAAPGFGWSAALFIDLAIRRTRQEI
ncbi:MAG: trehalase family glycosidase [Armatimonadota bacterium]|nr:trehalase family glycosidase [Armatimonadota bacterium]